MSSVVVATKDQVSSDLGDERVILGINSGVYYGLNDVGAQIWNLLQQPKIVSEIRDTLLEEYDVEREQCEHDILALLEQLKAQGLIEVKDEAIA